MFCLKINFSSSTTFSKCNQKEYGALLHLDYSEGEEFLSPNLSACLKTQV